MFTKRTDLAIEAHELWQESAGKTTRLAGVKATEKKIQGYPVTQVDILDREGEAALGKPAGSYRTLDLTAFWQRGDGFFDRAVRAVGQQVKELTPDSGPVLVVGLGNRAMTPDAVGPLAADSVLITRHLIDAMPQHFSGFRPVAALRPGVLGTTGVESAEAVRGLVAEVQGLLDSGVPAKCTAMQAIGYKEMAAALLSGGDVRSAAEEIQLRSRQYAKRQLTWFKRNKAARWLLWGREPDFAAALQTSTEYMEEFGLV